MFEMALLTFASGLSRGKSIYDLTQARSGADVFRALATATLSEIIFYRLNQQVRNKYRNW